jgi:UDP-N-acetylglucosamine acyltransferase
MSVHNLALVHSSAQVHESAIIHAFTTIGEHVVVGPRCEIGPHAHVVGRTTLAEDVRIFPYASVGEVPPDLKFKGEPATVEIGARTVVRENATITIGTAHGIMKTVVGSDCLIMSYCHVGHDSVIGKGVIMANCAQLAGHVEVADGVILGALSGVHQFCRLGTRAMLAGGAKVTQDVPPWTMAHGDRARLVGLNVERMRREQLTDDVRRSLKRAYRYACRQGMTPEEAASKIEGAGLTSLESQEFLSFVSNSQRGLCSARVQAK